ncbi:MAG: ABC-2 family transporter protein [Planctomycetaceae bacterium]|nr:ABC-2 family transporter protein [Planctomycetaceae bacterium]
MSFRPHYGRVWLTFLRNSFVRELTFRGNFLIEVVTRTFWFVAQVVLFEIIYSFVPDIEGWTREQYYAFMATGMLINSLVETLFMPNCANFSELIRTGDLDFALLKPIDTQFLVSFEKVDLAELTQVLLSGGLLWYALDRAQVDVTFANAALYLLLIAVGVAFFYSLMIVLASTSIWLGRNQGLYDFWFYITVFGRYPREFYHRPHPLAQVVWFGFSYLIPILLVVTVPSHVLLNQMQHIGWQIAVLAPVFTLIGLLIARRVFSWSLSHYRSASS